MKRPGKSLIQPTNRNLGGRRGIGICRDHLKEVREEPQVRWGEVKLKI